jgi:hypothetical protein
MLKRKSKYLLAAVLAPAAWLIFFSIDFEYDKKDDFGGGMTLISTTYVVRHPYWGIADSGGSFFIPFIPSSNSQMVRQKLVRNHTVLWEMHEEIPGLRSYCAAVSPDRHYLLTRQLVGNYFWRIHDLATGQYLELRIAEMLVPIGRHPHYNSFMLGRWSEDSKFVYAAEDGEEDHEGQQRSYREIYRIAASDLQVQDQDHCHQKLDPRQEQLNWDNTPCAGSYK